MRLILVDKWISWVNRTNESSFPVSMQRHSSRYEWLAYSTLPSCPNTMVLFLTYSVRGPCRQWPDTLWPHPCPIAARLFCWSPTAHSSEGTPGHSSYTTVCELPSPFTSLCQLPPSSPKEIFSSSHISPTPHSSQKGLTLSREKPAPFWIWLTVLRDYVIWGMIPSSYSPFPTEKSSRI